MENLQHHVEDSLTPLFSETEVTQFNSLDEMTEQGLRGFGCSQSIQVLLDHCCWQIAPVLNCLQEYSAYTFVRIILFRSLFI